jgi:hypothetical protein
MPKARVVPSSIFPLYGAAVPDVLSTAPDMLNCADRATSPEGQHQEIVLRMYHGAAESVVQYISLKTRDIPCSTPERLENAARVRGTVPHTLMRRGLCVPYLYTRHAKRPIRWLILRSHARYIWFGSTSHGKSNSQTPTADCASCEWSTKRRNLNPVQKARNAGYSIRRPIEGRLGAAGGVVKAYDLNAVQGLAIGNEVPFPRTRAWGRWRSAVVADPWYRKAGVASRTPWLQTMQMVEIMP